MNLPDFLTRDSFGEILLTGHRIGLYTVVRCYKEGYSAEKIAGQFPSLPLTLIGKVVAFYLKNQAEVDSYFATCQKEIGRQAAGSHQGPDLPELQRRWKELGLGELP